MNFRANIPWLAHSKPNALNAKRGADALRTLTFGAAVFISATAATAQDVQFFPFCPPGEGMSRAFGASPDCAVTVGEYIITMVVDNGTIVDVFDCAVAPDLPGCECPPCGNPFCECFCPLGISYSYLFNGFRWSGGTLLRLPPLDSETFNPWQLVSRANATSQGGTISVGRSRNISPSSVSSTQATAWDSAGNPISLGYHDVAPPTDLIVSYHSNAADVSADGTIIVGSSDFDEGEQCVPCPPNPAQVAMKWTLSGRGCGQPCRLSAGRTSQPRRSASPPMARSSAARAASRR